MERLEKSVTKLNSLLRGEISAVETYRQALAKVSVPTAKNELAECERSHEQRVLKLKDRVLALGGTPAEGSGAWGTFTKLIEGGAAALGDKAAIAALEEGEDRGLADYRNAMQDGETLDTESRSLVEQELLPAQMRTHRAMSSLKAALH
jgi:demethoxyubiquinone hydroxylase (CLK1/Coq7/Cat5 family)